MRLDKVLKDKILEPSIYVGVKDFFDAKLKYDAMDIQEVEFFKQLKPRLQKELLDIVFARFYEQFRYIFEEFDSEDPSFKRDLFKKCQFTYCQNFIDDELDINKTKEWPDIDFKPVVIEANQMSTKVYFVLSG